jgi:hypothetical protein
LESSTQRIFFFIRSPFARAATARLRASKGKSPARRERIA